MVSPDERTLYTPVNIHEKPLAHSPKSQDKVLPLVGLRNGKIVVVVVVVVGAIV